MSEENTVLDAFRALTTAAVSDALDRLGIDGQAAGIGRVAGGGTVAGRAYTVRYEPVGVDGGSVGDFIDDVRPGDVVVLANAGRLTGTIWGGLLSETAARRGVAATVVDGACRDVARARELGYSLYSRTVWMRTGKDRVRAEAIGVPVSIGGVRVRPGDIVVADDDGTLVVPAGRADAVLAAAREIETTEQAIRAEVAAGARLDEARARHRYHRLQQAVPGAVAP
ncbi:RraA family protein [Phytohabitans kaempferiae]|uniref:Putative 4-hydroxy-4-methyl-2-oxoglutarate aldolase n=1 Tax=Phytohabitans kaempferiae TaxID=1620943 RepID=A0ABV6LYW6_9ACTN